jgi:hypothetical protein
MAYSTGDHRINGMIAVNHTRFRSIRPEKVEGAALTVALGTARRDHGRVVLIPMAERLSLGIGMA